MAKTLVIIQARMSSTRLPGKVLRDIAGRSMLLRVVERAQISQAGSRLIVATSIDPTDDAVVELCAENNIRCFRGSLTDVLDRYYQCALSQGADHIVRLTADCPLLDPNLIDAVVSFHLRGGFDYTSNVLEPTFPDGLDTEVVSFLALEKAWRMAKFNSEREHVTLFFRNHVEKFQLGSFKDSSDNSAMRWTVDYAADIEFVTAIYQTFADKQTPFTTSEVIDFINENPKIMQLNSGITRNQGLKISLARDKESGI